MTLTIIESGKQQDDDDADADNDDDDVDADDDDDDDDVDDVDDVDNADLYLMQTFLHHQKFLGVKNFWPVFLA